MPCHGPKYPYPNSHDNLCPSPDVRREYTSAGDGLQCLVCAELNEKAKATKATKTTTGAATVVPGKSTGANKENVKF